MIVKDLFKLLPWYWKLWFVFITVVILCILLPYAILATCNPFWFRDAMSRSCHDLIDFATEIRQKLMSYPLKKYTLFETLKTSENSQ